MKIRFRPSGLPCTLRLCPPGLFLYRNTIGFKDEYGGDPFCAESGEFFWGGKDTVDERNELEVLPLQADVARKDTDG